MRILTCMLIIMCFSASISSCDKKIFEYDIQPRVIYWFTIDALRSDLIDLKYNNKQVMPTLTEFAKESVYFDNAYSQSSFTKISTASFFTGLWPSRLGVRQGTTNIFPKGIIHSFGLDYRFYTLAEYLVEKGYETHLYTTHVKGLIQGFKHQERSLDKKIISKNLSGGKKVFVYEHIVGLHAPYNPSRKALSYLKIKKSTGISPARYDWSFNPLKISQMRDLYKYYLAEGYDSDRYFSKLVKYLKRNNSWDDAMIIVTSDHGEAFLEHGSTQHSKQLYDEVLKVPLFIKFPQKSKFSKYHGKRFSNRVRLIDVFPTIARLIDQKNLLSLDGKSLIPVIKEDEKINEKRPVLAFVSNKRKSSDCVTSLYENHAIISKENKAIWGYRIDNSQLPSVFDFKRGDEIKELYNLTRDPKEKENIYYEKRDLFYSLKKEYINMSVPVQYQKYYGQTSRRVNKSPESPIETSETKKKLKSLGYIQ